MIYLRPSRRITPPGEGDPLMGHLYIFDEYLLGVQRARTPFTLVIESEHGSELDKDGVRETVLHLRIYGHDGSDLTDLLPADFAPEWCCGTTQVGVGMSLALTWQDLTQLRNTYSVTLTAWRIYRALASQKLIKQSLQRGFSEISCRGEITLYGPMQRQILSEYLNINERVSVIAGSVRLLSEQYSIEARTTGTPILKERTDTYTIECRVVHTPSGRDYTPLLLGEHKRITPRWYRRNKEGRDRIGISDSLWAANHLGAASVVITRDDFQSACTVGYTIERDEILAAIKDLEARDQTLEIRH